MNLNLISQNPGISDHFSSGIKSQSTTQEQGSLPFASMVQDVIQSVDTQQQTVAVDVAKVASGEADNLQAIAANVAKADLSFRFLMEMRDKLITSYQEIMRMQV